MRKAVHSHYRTLFLAVLAVAIFGWGCHKQPPAPPPPPPAPAPPPAKPTVTLQASPTTIQKGESATLSWSSTNATELKLEPSLGTVSPEGSTKVSPADSTTYTITATGPGGSADASAAVSVAQPPPPPPQPSVEELFLKEVQDAYFDFDKSDIRADAREALAKTADFLRRYPEVKVTIEGHCDERGSTEYNIGLGDRRAEAVRQYVISLGITADRLNTVSYGKERPFCAEHAEECWQQNRRGHFVMAH